MTIAVIYASPAGFGQITSAYGSYSWQTSPIVPQTYLPDSAGTLWIIWKVIGSIPPGQVLNGVQISGNNQYMVGDGGVTISRIGDVFVRMQKVFNDFMSQPGAYAQTVQGRGLPTPMTYVHKPDNFSSDDFNAGNCYVGMAVRTNTADTSAGAGRFQLGSLTFTFYFGGDTDVPPPGGIQSTLTNPLQNYSPGKLDYEDFASVNCSLDQPSGNQQYVYFTWDLPKDTQGNHKGLYFDNGTAQFIQGKGQAVDGSFFPYSSDSGPIHIVDRMPEGSYTIACTISGIGAAAPLTKTTQLFVRQNKAVMLMSEL
jgi:hypothetical protein